LVAAAAAKSIAAAENMQFHGAVPRNRFALDSILEFPRRPILALRRMRRHREVGDDQGENPSCFLTPL
jgi:hypothetical protein